VLTLEEQINQLADEAVRQHPPAAWTPSAGRRTNNGHLRWPLLAAVASLVAVLAVGLTSLSRETSEIDVADDGPSSPVATNVPTVEAEPTQMWWVPIDLPTGFDLDVAEVRYPSQYLRYIQRDGGAQVIIELGPAPLARVLRTRSSVDLDGNEWQIGEAANNLTVFMSLKIGDVQLSVTGIGMTESEVIEIASGLALKSATSLPRPPLDLATPIGVPVAEAQQNGRRKQLVANSDGVNVALWVDGASGSSVQLGDKAFVVAGGVGPIPFVSGTETQSLIWGVVDAAVASIDIELSDGRVVTAVPQDESDRFVENFFIAAVPTNTEDGFELVSAIVARSADGTELGRQTGAF
jgi:hypothetical protein